MGFDIHANSGNGLPDTTVTAKKLKLTLNSLHFLGFKPVVTTLGTEAHDCFACTPQQWVTM